ncbi:N-substituted formamide deformylase precursor [Pigmentiphaga humi]|uniref:N-substituted formamide deformylase n=1 Tax=Pigmentiphaga humi TaxID=2478468 RepID=A0A3P4AWV0_9BURK|nr:amidohydrolase family protein [Pigmentiphaga humi]VCU68517.1 N-substituted formamide deformylase precursor [Pigmentiphaga humi]
MPPSLVLHRGRIITCDDRGSVASALLVRGRHIAAVGSDADVLAAAEPHARRVDLGGKAVVPGLTDGHAHLDREGLRRHLPSLAGARTRGDVLDLIAAEAAKAPPGTWIVTQPIGEPPEYPEPEDPLAGGLYPDRDDLDRVSPRHPVYIRAIWGYWRNRMPLVSVANSLALARAGITPDTASPSPDVRIERDAGGRPTGRFIERTLVPIVEHTLMRAAPGFTAEQRAAGLRHAMAEYNRYGTTAVFEGHGVADEVIQAYETVRRQQAATVRATLVLSPYWGPRGSGEALELLREWRAWLAGKGRGDELLRVQGCYAEIDADPLNNTLRAANHPCTGWAGFQAGAALPEDILAPLLAEAAAAGIRVAGIWPNLLPLFEAAHRRHPIDGLRWVLGHQPVLDADTIARVRELGLVLTTHTNRHIYKDGDLWTQRRGPQGQDDIVPLRRLLDAGVPVAFGSDNLPVSLFGPIWHAVARQSRHGNPVAPSQAISRQEALAIATRGGAWLTGDETLRGSLEPGKLADLAVLDADPLTCDNAELPTLHALMTVVDGHIVASSSHSEIAP